MRFGRLFRERFMAIGVALPLEEALDLGWQTMAEFSPPRSSWSPGPDRQVLSAQGGLRPWLGSP